MKRVIVAGKMNLDVFYYVDEFKEGDNNVARDGKFDLGGKGANVSVALKKLGVEVSITGCIGNDFAGEFMKKKLDEYGVDTSHLKICDGESGRTAIVVERDGENTMFNYPGVNANFTPDMIDWTLIEEGDVLFVQFGIPADTVFEITSMAKRAGMMVYVDPSYPSEVPWDAFSYFDYIAPNEREILRITGKNDVEKAVKQFFKRGVETVLLKLGEKGVRIYGEKIVKDIEAFETDVVDTTGAGDSFNACFIYGKLRRMTDEECAVLGNVCASITISRMGTSSAFPTLDEVRERIEELGLKLRV